MLHRLTDGEDAANMPRRFCSSEALPQHTTAAATSPTPNGPPFHDARLDLHAQLAAGHLAGSVGAHEGRMHDIGHRVERREGVLPALQLLEVGCLDPQAGQLEHLPSSVRKQKHELQQGCIRNDRSWAFGWSGGAGKYGRYCMLNFNPKASRLKSLLSSAHVRHPSAKAMLAKYIFRNPINSADLC